ncbi:M24 family metallopeptidase C-terminal domain-containing protein, partial [Acinetobacter baumannii]
LQPGMILSNEPGYYRAGAYGIRIENLLAVQPCTDLPDAERPMLAFETLTLAPIDRTLIDSSLLTTVERNWIDNYHRHVRECLSPQLEEETRDW